MVYLNSDSDPVSSEDEETKMLLDRKKQLESEKSRLKDERCRKRQLREQRKIKLKAEVKTLENEVAELNETGINKDIQSGLYHQVESFELSVKGNLKYKAMFLS